MFLPQLSLKRPILASMMSLALILFGVVSLSRLPVRELPDIDPPIINVQTVYPGAGAEVVETEVTEPLEEQINNIEGIKTLTSQSREQVSNITIEFNLARSIDLAAQDVRDRVSRIRGNLPADIDEPIVSKQDADANPILWIGVRSDKYSTLELTTIVEKQIKNRLQTVEGVSSVRMGGEKRFAIRIWLDSEKMAGRQLTVLDVQRALQEQNVELPSGRIENLDREMTIKTRGELKSAEEFNQLIILADGSKLVRLRDIGRAVEGVEDMRTIARANGRPAVAIGVVKQSKANTITVAKGIKAKMDSILRLLPEGIEMSIGYDESIFVERAVDEVWQTLLVAFGLVVLVIFIFLRDIRATFIPAVAIPVSIISTFLVFYVFGYSINILTMLALVLAIGLVVDDTIVVLENIFRHMEEGMGPMEAAQKAMDEISFAVIATTVSLVAVFIPIAFNTGTTGRLFSEFAWVLSGAVIISTFVALSLSPMLSSRILKPTHNVKHGPVFMFFEKFFHGMTGLYTGTLNRVLVRRPFWMESSAVLAIWVALLSLVYLSYRGLENEFLPDDDKGRLFNILIAPEGATSEYTDLMVQEMEAYIDALEETDTYFGMVAPGFSGPGMANQGFVFVTLKDKSERERSVQEVVNAPGGLRQQFFQGIEGAIAIPQIPKSIGRSFGQPFQLVIQNQDLKELHRFAGQFANQLRQEGFLINVRSTFDFNKPELQVEIDRDRAAALGVSIAEISRTLQILFGGLDLSRFKLDGKEYEVIAQLDRTSRLTPEQLRQLYVRNDKGELVQLNNLVTYEVGPSPNSISRYNRLRSATIEATPVGITMGAAVQKTQALLAESMPEGFLYEWSGEAKDLRDSNQDVLFFLGFSIIIIYMALASQFESLIHPLTIMLALPLAALGAFGSLWGMGWLEQMGWIPVLGGMNLNLYSQIGLLLLVGLVTKNSILLVDYANRKVEEGMDVYAAMREAGLTRFRPILMTALSTIAGILPIAIGLGSGAESRRPMGITIVGGMITSGILTLYVIPMMYVLFHHIQNWFTRSKTVDQ